MEKWVLIISSICRNFLNEISEKSKMGCHSCTAFVSNAEYTYSVEHFGLILCRECQKNYGNLKKKHEFRKKRSSPQAKLIYDILIKNGFGAKLELWDGYKHIDIAIPEYKVNIEVDGKHHHGKKQALADLKRTYHSFRHGYVTLRIPNELANNELFDTAHYIMKILKESESQLNEDLEDED